MEREDPSHRAPWERDEIADLRDGAAASRDEEANARDRESKVRDEASIDRALRIRDHLWARQQGQKAERRRLANTDPEPDTSRRQPDDESMAQLLEQAIVDRELTASEHESRDAELGGLLEAMESNRHAAAEDRRAAARDREAAASDRRRADEDRRLAAADRDQAEIERNQEPDR